MVDEPDSKDVRFSQRDVAIFTKHLARFRLTTNEVLRRVMEAATINSVTKWVGRRREQGYLTTQPLPGDAHSDFHQLTAKAVTEFNLDQEAASPLRGQSLVRWYGMLSFCWLGPHPYRKLSRSEFIKLFPQLHHRHLEPPHYYYLDTDFTMPGVASHRRIGYIYVDDGKSEPAIFKRLRELMSQRLLIFPWKPLIAERGRFVITVVTTDDRRKWQLDMQLQREPRPVPVRVEVREDLERILGEKPAHAPQRSDNA